MNCSSDERDWQLSLIGLLQDFILFPDDATFSKVDTGRPDDRVVLLQYRNSPRRFFFWMQVAIDLSFGSGGLLTETHGLGLCY